ncbi:MAG: hypothetical protein QF595_06330 [Dehalococcoidia bacterium]|nr:hypothetical protein [Dehalococcoidia bacterium]
MNDPIDNPRKPAGEARFCHERTKSYLKNHCDSEWHRTFAKPIMAYIDERLPLMTEYEHACVSKHDLDIRDFLAVTEPKPRISGMLDWERVRGVDALTALVGIWVWLHYLDGTGWLSGAPGSVRRHTRYSAMPKQAGGIPANESRRATKRS